MIKFHNSYAPDQDPADGPVRKVGLLDAPADKVGVEDDPEKLQKLRQDAQEHQAYVDDAAVLGEQHQSGKDLQWCWQEMEGSCVGSQAFVRVQVLSPRASRTHIMPSAFHQGEGEYARPQPATLKDGQRCGQHLD